MFENVVGRIIIILFFYNTPIVVSEIPSYRDVTINQGVVRGYRQPEENIFTFENIPYATVPTGYKFYSAPLPPPTWNGTFEAIDKKTICQQPRRENTIDSNIQVQCLIVNIFVPHGEIKNLPVVVFVHGGAFLYGFGNSRTPKNLVKSGKVIAVTFNYRLGPHGFLCLGTKAAPGNAGLKDQIALLRWIQNNIEKFGGNPNDVTISGCSAGSVSVDILAVSKMAEGLFHKVIAGSSSNVNAFSVQTDPLKNAQLFAQLLGFHNINDLEALEIFYLETPYEVLANGTVLLYTRTDSVVLFSPCIEKDVGQEMSLDESPVKILESKNYTKLPMLYGFCEMEGLFRINCFDEWKTQMNENFLDFLPPDLGTSLKKRKTLANDIKEFYFGKEPVSDSNVSKYIDFFTDIMFEYGMLRSARLQLEAGNNQLYLYEYSFVHENDPFILNTTNKGATHCAQNTAVLDDPNEKTLSDEFKKMKAVMRELWLNFITTGAPVPQGSSYPAWPPMSLDRSFMSLNSTLEYRDALNPESVHFWDNIFKHHYIYPKPPDHSTRSEFELSRPL